MISKMLGIVDFAAVSIFIINLFDKFGWFPNSLVVAIGAYLIIKGIFFALILDFASFIDIFCGIIIVLSANFNMPWLLSAFVIIFLLQKAFFSIFS